jgi:hypothetical protein
MHPSQEMPGNDTNHNRDGNDSANISAIVAKVAHMTNQAAWTEIGVLLRRVGYRGAYSSAKRDRIWKQRGCS